MGSRGRAVLRVSPHSQLSALPPSLSPPPSWGRNCYLTSQTEPCTWGPRRHGDCQPGHSPRCPSASCPRRLWLLGRPLSSAPEVGLWSELPRPCLLGSRPAQALEGWSSGNPTTAPVSGHGPPPLSLSFLISQNKRTQEMPAAPASAEPLVNGGFSAPVCVTWNSR